MPFFPNSHNFVAHGPFIDQSVNVSVHNEIRFVRGTGFNALREASIPQAIHDSSARDPPRCFPGTREEHIRNITGWGLGDWRTPQARMLWLQGPAGVGKSALAQTCVERIEDRVGASFFFSRLKGWDDPTRFVPTIAYQLATKSEAYRDLVDAKIACDPFDLEKSIGVQFRELLVKPLGQLSHEGQGVEESVIVIDGLDECDGQDAQCAIIEVIATSVLQQSTPFLWAFFSRPEPHIAAAFASEQINRICLELTLPVSRDADRDIEAYLLDGFRMIRAKYNLPVTWPSEMVIFHLVDQASGLFAYVASVIRHIARSPGPFGPEQQLQLVLEAGRTSGNSGFANPLWNLDQFYVLVMKQIPKEILPITLLLLFAELHRVSDTRYLPFYCPILGFSPATVYAALSRLHSVVEIERSDSGVPVRLSFHHKSFADFLGDVGRSTPEFCVDTPDICYRFYSACLDTLCRLSIDATNRGEGSISLFAQWPNASSMKHGICITAMKNLFKLVRSIHMEADILRRLSATNWRLVAKLCHSSSLCPVDDVEAFFQKIPENWRLEIIHLLDYRVPQTLFVYSEGRSYVLGSGSSTVLLAPNRWNKYSVEPHFN